MLLQVKRANGRVCERARVYVCVVVQTADGLAEEFLLLPAPRQNWFDRWRQLRNAFDIHADIKATRSEFKAHCHDEAVCSDCEHTIPRATAAGVCM